MADDEWEVGPQASRFSLRAFLIRDWPYLAMLALAVIGVAYTSIAGQAMTTFWIVLSPFFAVICAITRWRDIQGPKLHWQLIQTQALHWVAVLVAMYLVRGGRKTNDELGRQRTHGADAVGAGDVYGRRPRCGLAYLPCRRRAGPRRSRHRLARTSNSAAPIGGHCIAFDSGAVRYASSEGARILSRLRRENQVFSHQRRQKPVFLPEGFGALTTAVVAAVGSSRLT